MKEERISKQRLQKLYSVDRTTIESWVKNHGLPMIRISSHSKYVNRSEWLEWEKQMTENKTTCDNEVG
jgi:hypothetical protein